MIAIVELSLFCHRFLACSSLLRHDGKQYRLSTYQGARLDRYSSRQIIVTQGPYRLNITLPLETTMTVPLLAPIGGSMERIIREHPRCSLYCQLYCDKELIFDRKSPCGSYELT